MPRISFSQKEIDGNPVSGTEFDRYLIQGDNLLLNQESLLKIDANGDAVEVPIGAAGQLLKVVAGSPVFATVTSDSLDSSDASATQSGHILLSNGLTLNWQTTTALAALASVTLTHSKPFASINLGSFISVVDLNNVVVQATTETLNDATIKNFDGVNPAATVRVFSLGI